MGHSHTYRHVSGRARRSKERARAYAQNFPHVPPSLTVILVLTTIRHFHNGFHGVSSRICCTGTAIFRWIGNAGTSQGTRKVLNSFSVRWRSQTKSIGCQSCQTSPGFQQVASRQSSQWKNECKEQLRASSFELQYLVRRWEMLRNIQATPTVFFLKNVRIFYVYQRLQRRAGTTLALYSQGTAREGISADGTAQFGWRKAVHHNFPLQHLGSAVLSRVIRVSLWRSSPLPEKYGEIKKNKGFPANQFN